MNNTPSPGQVESSSQRTPAAWGSVRRPEVWTRQGPEQRIQLTFVEPWNSFERTLLTTLVIASCVRGPVIPSEYSNLAADTPHPAPANDTVGNGVCHCLVLSEVFRPLCRHFRLIQKTLRGKISEQQQTECQYAAAQQAVAETILLSRCCPAQQ